MNTEKFTPGNWRRAMNKSRNGKTIIGLSHCRIENENGVVIAFTVPQKSRQEQVANTNLLATAKMMYRALEDVCSDCEILSNWEDLFNIGRPGGTQMPPCPCKDCYVEKALKKARGENEH